MRWVVSAVVTVLAGLLIWAVVDMNRWANRCEGADGMVETRFEYYQTTYVQVGNTQVPQMTPVYSYHCWVDGREIEL